MLEDPSYESIVRWGENGDSFVVLEVRLDVNPIAPIHLLTAVHRTRSLPSQSYRNTSSIPTLRVSSDN